MSSFFASYWFAVWMKKLKLEETKISSAGFEQDLKRTAMVSWA